jgi:hypothetical protein
LAGTDRATFGHGAGHGKPRASPQKPERPPTGHQPAIL